MKFENQQNLPLKITEEGTIITVKLTPNASKSEVIGVCEDYIKIRISAPANENKANKKLIVFTSELFNISKTNIIMLSGEKSRVKKLLLKNKKSEEVAEKIYLYDKIDS